MGDLSDRPSTTPAASGPQYPSGWNPYVTEGEWEAEAVSPAYSGEVRPSEEELIRGWKLDPDLWEIVDGTLIVNRWQGMTGKDRGNELVWQHQYKARLRRKVLGDDEKLPYGIRQVPHFAVKVTGRPRARKGSLPWGDTSGVGVFYPDPQFGYWWDEHGVLHTIHDERCFDIRNQIMVDVRAEYGRIDKTVGAGDTGDFTHFSRFTSSPNYLERTLQPTLDRIGLDAQQMRAICPGDDEEIVLLDGNHDNPRLINTLIQKGLGALVGLRRANDPPDAHPVLSLQNLVRLDDYRVNYVEPYPTGLVEFNENLGCAHGPAYSSKKLGTATAVLASARRSMLHGHCFDDATEILTPDGWKTHDTLREGSVVMTLNRETNRLEWNLTSAVYRYTHHDELVHIRNENVKLAITGGHGLWTKPQKGEWREESADQAFGKSRVLRLAAEHDEEELLVDDDVLRLIAWIMRDDSIKDVHRLTIHAGWWPVPVTKYMDADKTPKRALAGMSVRQMRLFIGAWVDGDGSRNQSALHSMQTSSARRDHMDLLQELACRCGYRTSLYPDESSNGTLWRMTINTALPATKVTAAQWTREPYDGVTWCVTVPNGTLMVRRAGHTAITLNTHREEHIAVTLWTERGPRTYYVGSPGTFCRTDLVVPSAKSNVTSRGVPAVGQGTEDWQNGLFVVLYDQAGEGHFNIENVRIWSGLAHEPGVAYWRDRKYVSTCDADGNLL